MEVTQDEMLKARMELKDARISELEKQVTDYLSVIDNMNNIVVNLTKKLDEALGVKND